MKLGEDQSKGSILWTGGGVFKDNFYVFPGTSYELLKINCNDKTIEEINLSLDYQREHRYGGVINLLFCDVIDDLDRNGSELLGGRTES